MGAHILSGPELNNANGQIAGEQQTSWESVFVFIRDEDYLVVVGADAQSEYKSKAESSRT